MTGIQPWCLSRSLQIDTKWVVLGVEESDISAIFFIVFRIPNTGRVFGSGRVCFLFRVETSAKNPKISSYAMSSALHMAFCGQLCNTYGVLSSPTSGPNQALTHERLLQLENVNILINQTLTQLVKDIPKTIEKVIAPIWLSITSIEMRVAQLEEKNKDKEITGLQAELAKVKADGEDSETEEEHENNVDNRGKEVIDEVMSERGLAELPEDDQIQFVTALSMKEYVVRKKRVLDRAHRALLFENGICLPH
ncbi:hypothetical protein RND71_018156 [Anisodus tanguticus]|uniref:Uncharacterized protein n=1 Tax=Anisodus tanguticus TaxID=243964 RepID=A0AAE1S3U5_9SOLA|nr:hypothetical protein RND71_018156 [Anisodus tanguticus]